MLDIYVNIKNTLMGLEDALRVAISNANNFNTPGYKYVFASFSTIFSETISSGTANINPLTISGGMTLGSTTSDFTQGSIGAGSNLSAAISGNGFFILGASSIDITGSGPKVYSRNGTFQTDASLTHIVDPFGRKLFGFNVDNNGNVISRNLVPLDIKGNTDVGFTDNGFLVGNFQARKDAIANGDPNPPEHIFLGKIAVTTFRNRDGLLITDGGALQATPASGEPIEPRESGEDGIGSIFGESLESSNVDVARVSLDMSILNRGFSSVQGTIDDINKISSTLISKIVA